VKALGCLWGGIIRRFEVNLLDSSVDLLVEVSDTGESRSHHLHFAGLRELRLVREPPVNWDYAELTSIEVTPEADGQGWNVVAEMWSSEPALMLKCGRVLMDGRDLGVIPGE
jgi:hypothetical protein